MSKAILCSDCLKRMKAIDLLPYHSSKANLQVLIRELVCLDCGSSAYAVEEIKSEESSGLSGRIETLECSLTSEKIIKEIDEDLLFDLAKEFYYSNFVKLCHKLYNTQWVYRFEVAIWDLINDNEAMSQLKAYSELRIIKDMHSKINLWPIDPAKWKNPVLEIDNFVTVDQWLWMYKNYEQLTVPI